MLHSDWCVICHNLTPTSSQTHIIFFKDVYPDDMKITPKGGGGTIPPSRLIPENQVAPRPTVSAAQESYDRIILPRWAWGKHKAKKYLDSLKKRGKILYSTEGAAVPSSVPRPGLPASLSGVREYTNSVPQKSKRSGWLTGLEPATSAATERRSNQLSYSHHTT